MRLSPQQIDDQINAELDADPWCGITGCTLTTASTWTQEVYSKLSAEQMKGTPRTMVHKRHGAKPTLDHIENGWRA